jgi:predicted ATP-grasp superfamily ATP-dependent carboligase
VNPRFQGTLECVEKHANINLVETHIEACLKGVLPVIKTKQTRFFTRLILYSPKKTRVPELTSFGGLRDIPIPGSNIEKAEPLCSVLTEGESRKESYENALLKAEMVYATVN